MLWKLSNIIVVSFMFVTTSQNTEHNFATGGCGHLSTSTAHRIKCIYLLVFILIPASCYTEYLLVVYLCTTN